MKKFTLLLWTAVFVFAAGPAYADEGQDRGGEGRQGRGNGFGRFDRNVPNIQDGHFESRTPRFEPPGAIDPDPVDFDMPSTNDIFRPDPVREPRAPKDPVEFPSSPSPKIPVTDPGPIGPKFEATLPTNTLPINPTASQADPNDKRSVEIKETYQTDTYTPAEEVGEGDRTWGAIDERIRPSGSGGESSFLFILKGPVVSVDKKKKSFVIKDKMSREEKRVYASTEELRSLHEGSIAQVWLKPGSSRAEKVQQVR